MKWEKVGKVEWGRVEEKKYKKNGIKKNKKNWEENGKYVGSEEEEEWKEK